MLAYWMRKDRKLEKYKAVRQRRVSWEEGGTYWVVAALIALLLIAKSRF